MPRAEAETTPPILLLVDVQRGFDDPGWGERNNDDAESRIAELLGAWRAAGAPVVHVRHESVAPGGVFKPGTEAFQFRPEATPVEGEPIVDKQVNSGFIGTDLEGILRGHHPAAVVIAGFTTDHCCSTTARMAGNLGFETYLVSDATATFARRYGDRLIDAGTMHLTALASLSQEFAEIVDTAGALRLLESRAAQAAPAL